MSQRRRDLWGWIVLALFPLVLHSPVRAQEPETYGAALTSPQGASFVLSPADSTASEVLRVSHLDPASNTAAVGAVTGGFDFGRPDLSCGVDWSRTVNPSPKLPVTLDASAGYDLAGEAVKSALGLPGDKQSSSLSLGINLRPASSLWVEAGLDQSDGGALSGSANGFLVSVKTALSDAILLSASGLQSVGGPTASLGSLGFLWRPVASEWSISGGYGFGSARLLPMIDADAPDGQPSRFTLSIAAPIASEMDMRLSFRSGLTGMAGSSLDSFPVTATITRNL